MVFSVLVSVLVSSTLLAGVTVHSDDMYPLIEGWAPALFLWECLLGKPSLAPGSQQVRSPLIGHSHQHPFDLGNNTTFTQPTDIIIGEEIAKRGLQAVRGQKEIFSIN